jgi:hypothetical protein
LIFLLVSLRSTCRSISFSRSGAMRIFTF